MNISIFGRFGKNASYNEASVDPAGRIAANAVSTLLLEQASIEGVGFNINTGPIPFNTTNETPVLYFKNTGEKDINIPTVLYMFGTALSGETTMIIYQNPAASSTLTEAKAVLINKNKNAGARNTINALAYKGEVGDTFTATDAWYFSMLSNTNNPYAINTGSLVLKKNDSILITVKLPASTATNVSVALATNEYPLPTE